VSRRICFFAKVASPEVLERVEFYAQDIRILRELGYDVVIATDARGLVSADCFFIWWWTWAFIPLAWAKLLGRPAVVTGVFDLPFYDQRSFIEKQLLSTALRMATVNVFCSKMEMRDIPARFRTTRPVYSPLTVDTAIYSPGTAQRGNTVLTVALLEAANSERKGVPDVIRAAPLIHRAHPEVTFLIAGEKGTHYPVLERMVRDLGAEAYVHFLGKIPTQEKIRLMQECRIYLQPTRHEGFGLAILEALSCGAPVVTRLAGAVGEVVGEAAEVIEGDSPDDVAATVIRLLDDDERRKALSVMGRSRADISFRIEGRKQALGAVLSEFL
jgi:glycosyltransferase involved in cell wall biosynthesis